MFFNFEGILFSYFLPLPLLQLIYFLTTIALWLVEYIFSVDGDTMRQLPQSVS